MNRRQFLSKSAITAIGLGVSSPLLDGLALGAGRRSARATGSAEKVVVALNLLGGNDGLNTLIPVSQYSAYRSYRPAIGIPQERALALEGTHDVALNPGMRAIRDLYARGRVAIVPGVGAPQGSGGLFDHEAQQREMQSADPAGGKQSGWLGRFLDTVTVPPDGILPPGVDLGGGRLTVDGDQRDAIALTSVGEFTLQTGFDSEARSKIYARMMQHPAPGGAAEWNREVRRAAVTQAETLRAIADAYLPAVPYPDNPVASSLYQCAELIAGNLDVRAITVGFDGFDTHVAQNDGAGPDDLGYHDQLLESVSSAVGAFYDDLEGHGLADDVVIVVFSEFGRRPKENSDAGTDHGYGSVWFVAGGAVKGGLYGDYPSIASGDLVLDGNVPVTTDFRSVYATILARHMDCDPVPVLGGDFPQLSFL